MPSSPNAPRLVIAVDGPAASGKGTIARALSREFGLPHMDTGALYRAVGLAALSAGIAMDDPALLEAVARRLDLSLLEHPALRTAATADAASRVSAVPAVRGALFDLQRAFASQPNGAVLDGRDIGTVIAPDAIAKLFVTAAPEVRARRRHTELAASGVSYEDVLADIRARDARDSGRSVAPLMQAADSVLLDTSNLSIGAAVQRAVEIVRRAVATRAGQG